MEECQGALNPLFGLYNATGHDYGFPYRFTTPTTYMWIPSFALYASPSILVVLFSLGFVRFRLQHYCLIRWKNKYYLLNLLLFGLSGIVLWYSFGLFEEAACNNEDPEALTRPIATAKIPVLVASAVVLVSPTVNLLVKGKFFRTFLFLCILSSFTLAFGEFVRLNFCNAWQDCTTDTPECYPCKVPLLLLQIYFASTALLLMLGLTRRRLETITDVEFGSTNLAKANRNKSCKPPAKYVHSTLDPTFHAPSRRSSERYTVNFAY